MTLSRRWLLLFALGGLPLLLTGVAPVLLWLTLFWYGFMIVIALLDGRTLPPAGSLSAEREVEERLTLASPNEVCIRLHNTGTSPLRMELRDSPPVEATNDLPETPFLFTVSPGERHRVVYHLTPPTRGDYTFGDLFLRVHGRLGMVQRVQHIPATQAVKVYPPILDTTAFALMARRGRLQQAGVRAVRLRGMGREFESLRDYQPDDELRRIDWKATARRGKLVARQYEVERSQAVILALDVGRTMLAEIDGVPKMDYAIQAALTLAYVATLAEDRVGLLIFSDRVHTWLPPKKGRSQVYALLDALYNVQATLAEPDYRIALSELRLRWRRRSLMVCFTDVWDADSSRQNISEMASLQPHHLVAAVTLLDTKLLRSAAQEPTDAVAIYEKAAAMQVLEDRQKATNLMAQRGLLVVDTPAEKLSAALVNRYLEVKERMLL